MGAKVQEEESKFFRQENINTIVTASTVGVFTGILISIALGFFEISSSKEIPSWISAFTAIAATCISAVAVFLVASTLKATRQTLLATRQMAEDQKRIGDTQARAWVFVESIGVGRYTPGYQDDEIYASVQINFKNYGPTPATNFNFSSLARPMPYPIPATPLESLTGHNRIPGIPPSDKSRSKITGVPIIFETNVRTCLRIAWTYDVSSGDEQSEIQDFIIDKDGDEFEFRPVSAGDRANFGRSGSMSFVEFYPIE